MTDRPGRTPEEREAFHREFYAKVQAERVKRRAWIATGVLIVGVMLVTTLGVRGATRFAVFYGALAVAGLVVVRLVIR